MEGFNAFSAKPQDAVLAGMKMSCDALEAFSNRHDHVDGIELSRLSTRLSTLARRAESAAGGSARVSHRKLGTREPSESDLFAVGSAAADAGETAVSDRRDLLSRGNSNRSLGSTGSQTTTRTESLTEKAGEATELLGHLSDAKGPFAENGAPENKETEEHDLIGSMATRVRASTEPIRSSLESKLCLFNTELATHARRVQAIVKEELTAKRWWTVDPQSAFRITWDVITAVFLVYVAFWEPFRLGYVPANSKLPLAHATWEALLDAFFVLDLFVNMNTGFVTGDGEVVMEPLRAAKHYCTSWFPIDFVSSMPPVLEYFLGWAARPSLILTPWVNPGDSGGGGASSLRAAKLLKIGRVFKIFKVFRIAKILKISSDSQVGEFIDDFLMSSASKTAMKLINIVGFTAIFAHFLSCFFAACGGMTMAKYHPILGHRPAKDWNRLRQYLLGLYWAITTISTVGYGDVIPKSDSERAYTILAMVVGSGFYGYVVAQAASIISCADANNAKYYEKMDSVAVWMKHHRFPSRIRREVRRYYRAYYSQRLAIDEKAIFDDLSADLAQNIAEFLLHDVIVRHPLFEELPEGLVAKFVTLTRLTRAVEGDKVIVEGEESHSMFIVLSGTARVTLEGRGDGLVHSAMIGEGDSFGELAALGIEAISDATVTATGELELYVLNYADMLQAFGGCAEETLEAVRDNVQAIHRRQIALWSLGAGVEPAGNGDGALALALDPPPPAAGAAKGGSSPPPPAGRFLATTGAPAAGSPSLGSGARLRRSVKPSAALDANPPFRGGPLEPIPGTPVSRPSEEVAALGDVELSAALAVGPKGDVPASPFSDMTMDDE